MDKEERDEAKEEFKKPRFIFSFGFILLGLLITQLGIVFRIDIISIIGIILFAIGGVVSIIDTWRTSKWRSLLIVLLLLIAVYFLYPS